LKDEKIREGPAERHQGRLREERMRNLATAAIERKSTTEAYESRPVRLIDKNGGPDWLPAPHQFHANVKIWVTHSPTHKTMLVQRRSQDSRRNPTFAANNPR
jgi:hypothetical protein